MNGRINESPSGCRLPGSFLSREFSKARASRMQAYAQWEYFEESPSYFIGLGIFGFAFLWVFGFFNFSIL